MGQFWVNLLAHTLGYTLFDPALGQLVSNAHAQSLRTRRSTCWVSAESHSDSFSPQRYYSLSTMDEIIRQFLTDINLEHIRYMIGVLKVR